MNLFTVAGVPIRLHGSFLVLAVVAVAWQALSEGPAAATSVAIYGLMLFGSVLVHELGHALAGRLFGVATRDITLFPFGGVARMEIPRLAPLAEAVIALAGPMTNVLIALGAWLVVSLGGSAVLPLVVINVALAIFNLIPAWPMDGGRVFRAMLSVGLGPSVAAAVALTISRALAWVMIIGALVYGQWSLALVGAFLLFMVGGERARLGRAEARVREVETASPRRWLEPDDEQRSRLSFPHPMR